MDRKDRKFVLFADLGVLVVPKTYVHGTSLTVLRNKNRRRTNRCITDQNFSNPSCILKPGDRFRVKVFRQAAPGTTTSEERMEFLAKEKSVYLGAQGAALVWEEKRNELPKGVWYIYFDEKECLWDDLQGHHGMLFMGAERDGTFTFGLGYFEQVWDANDVLVCFYKLDA